MMRQRRKICVITGTRAEFGLLKPVMEKIHASDSLELQVIATGMHLLSEHGSTISEIESAGLPVHARIPIIVSGDDKPAMTLSIGLGIISFTQVLSRLNPDIVLVLGDRFEIFSAAIAASFSGHVVAHMSGGDTLQAGYDEYVRHSITKISHIHFPSTKNSAERIIKLGENPDRIFVVGSTALDTILNKTLPSREDLLKKYPDLSDGDFALVIQHPISTDPLLAGQQMGITLDAIRETGLRIIVIYPNNDPGGKKIIDVIDMYKKRYPDQLTAFKSLPFEDYLGMMNIASVMVGNSSSGIIESSSFHLPVVNIGDRQKGRERSENIIDVSHDKTEIKNAINIALHDDEFRNAVFRSKNPYGDGHASERIVDTLSRIEITPDIFKKKITY